MEPVNVKSINKFLNALLVSNWKTALNFLSISISEKVTWTGSDEGRHGGSQMKRKRKMISFYFFNFFVNRLYSFFTIIIIKCKASFSCHSSSSHYSTQGFVLISFHFTFSFLIKNKKNKILCNFTSDLLLCLQITNLKCGQKLPSEWVLERKRFRFFDHTFLL